MRYPITFYNAIWLILFGTLFFKWSWIVFILVFLFSPTWQHLREWYDLKKRLKDVRATDDTAGKE